jgi:hypothetical protein
MNNNSNNLEEKYNKLRAQQKKACKKYYEKNKDAIIEKNKNENKTIYMKEYKQINRDKLNEKRREHYQKVKDSDEWKAQNKINYLKAYAKQKEKKIIQIFDRIKIDEELKNELLNKMLSR